ncbi:adenylate kinase 7a isoform X1 [Syngnathus scovelli]|uniref:adenylate kinase 7a isoform X1 n=1 Tax=Syngnathus scovelli TaxID=161590 RepID=UPI002110B10D|nr:adenylate kinase 7a isoform X1 [Syngnathus scovelli]
MGDKKRYKRIFVNDVDKYSSKHIAEYLSSCGVKEVDEDDDGEPQPHEPAFQVVGTVSSSSAEKPSGLHEHYSSLSREELLPRLLECDVVVYNISENANQDDIEDATWAITALHGEMENFRSKKTFILVSTVLTWAMTKRPETDEAEKFIAEDEFRKRRPHPSFKHHNNTEKQVLKLGTGKKNKLKGYVLAAGIQYGKGENLFHYFFKVSWLSEFSEVPIFGEGTNFIPTIHVLDLAKAIQSLIDLKPKSKYILAIDDSKSKLRDIVQAVSQVLGTGKLCQLPEKEAISTKAFKQEELEYISIDLRLDAFVVKDTFNFNWSAENGMIENVEALVEEYRHTRKLLPIRIFLTGPPAVGKSEMGRRLSEHYRIHHINIRDVIEEKMAHLKETSARIDADISQQETALDQLETIKESMEKNAGRLEDDLLLEILTEKLNSKPCRNQGYVLYGFPRTFEQASQMFSAEDADIQDPSATPACNSITPEYVFALDASDEFLTKKVQDLPESEAQKRGLTQEEFIPRLVRFRQLSRALETALDYFDELEIYPTYLEVKDDDPELTQIMSHITEAVGAPKKYGLNTEELEEEEKRMREMERKQKEAEEAAERKRRKGALLAEMAAEYEVWQDNLAEVERQEQELLEAKALPLRNYLMKYVMPALSEALQECSKIKPNDPVSFLAEYLLRMDKT